MSYPFTAQSPYRQSFRRTHIARPPAISRQNRARVDALKMKLDVGPMTVIVGLMVLSLLMSFLYLAHFNKVSTKGYELRRLEADRQQLLSEYELRDIHLAEIKSLAAISESSKVSSMRQVSVVNFVRNTALASADRL